MGVRGGRGIGMVDTMLHFRREKMRGLSARGVVDIQTNRFEDESLFLLWC